MTPKTWQDVLLRREYLRGYQDGVWGPPMKHLTELAELEMMKPCERCKGTTRILRNEDPYDAYPCPDCKDTGIAP